VDSHGPRAAAGFSSSGITCPAESLSYLLFYGPSSALETWPNKACRALISRRQSRKPSPNTAADPTGKRPERFIKTS